MPLRQKSDNLKVEFYTLDRVNLFAAQFQLPPRQRGGILRGFGGQGCLEKK
jgi:hypothetical protein